MDKGNNANKVERSLGVSGIDVYLVSHLTSAKSINITVAYYDVVIFPTTLCG